MPPAVCPASPHARVIIIWLVVWVVGCVVVLCGDTAGACIAALTV
jgi:hypothetical protein